MPTPTSDKPVLPHYSPCRRALWNLASGLRIKAQSCDADVERYQGYIREETERAAEYRAQADAVEKSARALGGMDKAGIIVEPDEGAAPGTPSKPPSVRVAC